MVSRPFFRRGMSGQGRTVTLVDTLKNEVYVFFYYGSNLPQVGNYYNVFDTEVAQHSEFRGLKQLVLEDIDGGHLLVEGLRRSNREIVAPNRYKDFEGTVQTT